MPTPNRSHERLTKDFLTLFNCTHLPSEAALISFLEQHKLGCFVRKEAELRRITINRAEINYREIFCLPFSASIPDDFIQKLSKVIHNCPVILYWTWELPENKGYVALRISLERIDSEIHFQTEILHPLGSHSEITPIHELIDKLAIRLYAYDFISDDPPSATAPVVGDEIYWTALGLFLKLAQADVNSYINEFKIWKQKQESTFQHAGEQLLSLVPYVHTNLFYVEKGLAIANMDLLRNLTDKFTPKRSRNIPLISLLRIAALCHVSYEVFTKKDYLTLVNFPLIYGLNYLMTRAGKKIKEGYTGFFLFVLCQWFATALQLLAFNLYAASLINDPIQRDISAPRYVFQWMTAMIKETIKLPIHLLGQTLFFFLLFCAEKLFHRPLMNTAANQAGFQAIAFSAIKLFIVSIEQYLFQFNRWVFPQNAEERMLSYMLGECEKYHGFEIKSARATRVLHQAFFNTQTLSVEVKSKNTVTQCELEISQNNTNATKLCADYKVECQSHFFMGDTTNATSAVSKSSIKHPTRQYQYC
ncbi:MAG: hypothetical protein NTZ67_07720 [Gammaproteobacteria bacterium]|nr:hypothetical protein [Gammaproteobacteria bacterium]